MQAMPAARSGPAAPPAPPRRPTGRLARWRRTGGGALWLGYFYASMALVGAGGVALALPFLLPGLVWRPPRRRGAAIFRRGVHVLMRCQPWLRADVRIAPAPLGAGVGTLYVSNHRSTLDVYFLLAHVDGVRVLAKRTLALVPVLGEIMWLTRQVFVAKGDAGAFLRAMRRVERGLRDGDNIHVFPELTRCPPGHRGTQKFAVAPFQAALAAGVRVVPIVFDGTDAAWPKGRYALRSRAPIRVRSLPPLDARGYADARMLMLDVRARIDAALGAPA